MKNKAQRLIIISVCVIAILLYMQYMNSENRRLSRDLEHLNNRIRMIELDNNMQKIISLKGDNALMKEKIIKLQGELAKVNQEKNACQKQLDLVSPKPKGSKQPAAAKQKAQNNPASQTQGNRGYIFKR